MIKGMQMKKYALVLLATMLASPLLAQPYVAAPAAEDLQRVWHLGRVTGDLERIIHFYHDVLGLNLRGEREAAIPFYSVAAINEFVDAPANAEFRAAFMPIPYASDERNPQNQIYLEAFEYRNIERHQLIPPLSDIGVSSMRVFVMDIDAVLAKVKAAGETVLTNGGEPVNVAAPRGFSGTARAVMLRDPDGYPVELMQLTDGPALPAIRSNAQVVGMQMTLVVENLERALDFYQRFAGSELNTQAASDWQPTGFSELRNLVPIEWRNASVQLPGSTLQLELVELRGVSQQRYTPKFQDIGFGHIAFMVRDIEVLHKRMGEFGLKTLSASGTWTQINPNLRAIYTRDPDGLFLELIEQR